MKTPSLLLGALLLPCLQAGAENYIMQAGNPQRWNQAPSACSVQSPLTPRWTYQSSFGGPFGGPIVLPGQVVYNRSAGMESVDRATGTLLWDLPGDYPETPTYDGDRNLIYTTNTNGTTIAVSPSGQVVWTAGPTSANAVNQGAPIYVNNLIYAPTAGEGIVCLDPSQAGLTVWTSSGTTSWNGATFDSPAYYNGQVFAQTTDGFMFCMDATTGDLIWQRYSQLTSGSTLLVQGQYFYRNCSAGMVECRSISDGALVWSYQCESWTNSDMAFEGDVLIVSNDDRFVRAFVADTGQCLWIQHFNGNFAKCAPIIACGQIFISGCAYQYYGIDGQNGTTQWIYPYPGGDAFVDWAEADGDLFTADDQGNLYDFTSVTPGDPALCQSLHAWTFTPTATSTPTSTPTDTASATPTATPSPTISWTPTSSPSLTASGTSTPTSSPTPSPTESATPSATPTATQSATPSASPSATGTATASPTPTQSATPTASPSVTLTSTASPTTTASPTSTASPTASATATASVSFTRSPTASATATASPSSTRTPLCTPTAGTPTPAAGCVPGICKLEVAPNPLRACSLSDACIAVQLKPCGAKHLKCRIFTVAMSEAASWDDDRAELQGGGWVRCGLPANPGLKPGVYYLSVEAQDEGAPAHACTAFMVLP